ncbi:MAG: 3-isopropylmalate dehydratase small subunit [Desulfobacteraceae bacterium]|nr:MAG: 3-isopropylmalate dehydratase small subunit [Desulfobacteraceae bacterium]
MNYAGNIWKFGDHVDTDLIIPARFLNVSDARQLAENCFADIRPDFVKKVQPGDILVAGVNFGCGSSREHAPLAIKTSGIGLVIAKSFARIFYRNAFNIGLPILECPEAVEAFAEGEALSVDLLSGEIRGKDKTLRAKPLPEFMSAMIRAGGLVPYIRQQEGF